MREIALICDLCHERIEDDFPLTLIPGESKTFSSEIGDCSLAISGGITNTIKEDIDVHKLCVFTYLALEQEEQQHAASKEA